jgi:hypothetical protein
MKVEKKLGGAPDIPRADRKNRTGELNISNVATHLPNIFYSLGTLA